MNQHQKICVFQVQLYQIIILTNQHTDRLKIFQLEMLEFEKTVQGLQVYDRVQMKWKMKNQVYDRFMTGSFLGTTKRVLTNCVPVGPTLTTAPLINSNSILQSRVCREENIGHFYLPLIGRLHELKAHPF